MKSKVKHSPLPCSPHLQHLSAALPPSHSPSPLTWTTTYHPKAESSPEGTKRPEAGEGASVCSRCSGEVSHSFTWTLPGGLGEAAPEKRPHQCNSQFIKCVEGGWGGGRGCSWPCEAAPPWPRLRQPACPPAAFGHLQLLVSLQGGEEAAPEREVQLPRPTLVGDQLEGEASLLSGRQEAQPGGAKAGAQCRPPSLQQRRPPPHPAAPQPEDRKGRPPTPERFLPRSGAAAEGHSRPVWLSPGPLEAQNRPGQQQPRSLWHLPEGAPHPLSGPPSVSAPGDWVALAGAAGCSLPTSS